MNANPQTSTVDWRDPIVEELHELRAQLVEKYQGNLHAYSETAKARTMALGFQFTVLSAPPAGTSTTFPSDALPQK